MIMIKPTLSKDFTMDDIRKLRDYNSARHLNMSNEEARAEGESAMVAFLISVGKSGKIKVMVKV